MIHHKFRPLGACLSVCACLLGSASAQAVEIGEEISAILDVRPGMSQADVHDALTAQGLVLIPGASRTPGAFEDVTTAAGEIVSTVSAYAKPDGSDMIQVELGLDRRDARVAYRITGVHTYPASDHAAVFAAAEAKFSPDWSCFDPAVGVAYHFNEEWNLVSDADCEGTSPAPAQPMDRAFRERVRRGEAWPYTVVGISMPEQSGYQTLIQSIQDNRLAAEVQALALAADRPARRRATGGIAAGDTDADRTPPILAELLGLHRAEAEATESTAGAGKWSGARAAGSDAASAADLHEEDRDPGEASTGGFTDLGTASEAGIYKLHGIELGMPAHQVIAALSEAGFIFIGRDDIASPTPDFFRGEIGVEWHNGTARSLRDVGSELGLAARNVWDLLDHPSIPALQAHTTKLPLVFHELEAFRSVPGRQVDRVSVTFPLEPGVVSLANDAPALRMHAFRFWPAADMVPPEYLEFGRWSGETLPRSGCFWPDAKGSGYWNFVDDRGESVFPEEPWLFPGCEEWAGGLDYRYQITIFQWDTSAAHDHGEPEVEKVMIFMEDRELIDESFRRFLRHRIASN